MSKENYKRVRNHTVAEHRFHFFILKRCYELQKRVDYNINLKKLCNFNATPHKLRSNRIDSQKDKG